MKRHPAGFSQQCHSKLAYLKSKRFLHSQYRTTVKGRNRSSLDRTIKSDLIELSRNVFNCFFLRFIKFFPTEKVPLDAKAPYGTKLVALLKFRQRSAQKVKLTFARCQMVFNRHKTMMAKSEETFQ